MNVIRKVTLQDKQDYLAMMRDFYSGEAVLHSVPEENFETTFSLLMEGTPYGDGFVILDGVETAGYFLTALTYSNEVGGIVVMFEEIYMKPAARGTGLGGRAIREAIAHYSFAKRIRLEVTDCNRGAIKLYEKIGFQNFDYKQMVMELAQEEALPEEGKGEKTK